MQVAWGLVGAAIFVVAYAYVIYPACLKLLAVFRRYPAVEPSGAWTLPYVTITIPAYNEAMQIADLLDSVLRIDYPRDRLQVLVVSDASDDGTDEIVRGYADRGIELLRMPVRGGKSAAENAARTHLRGDIIVNTDASIRIEPGALKRLVSRFSDPRVGLASGRDVSVTSFDGEMNAGESIYVGYEMWVRSLETDLSGIVGASGCFYAIRRELHSIQVPEGLSRDFAAALVTRERGFRAVTANDAVCFVPRVPSLKSEYRRKVRTIACGMGTLYYKRHLMNVRRHGLFAWMLFSHKVCRWAAPWAVLVGSLAVLALAPSVPVAAIATVGMAVFAGLAVMGWNWPEHRSLPRLVSMPAFIAAGNVAVLHATLEAMRGPRHAVWEPTRRNRGAETAAAR